MADHDAVTRREALERRMDEGAHLIPRYMLPGMKRYILDGIAPGSFLSRLLENDFMGAAGKADEENGAALMGWGKFFYNHIPADAFGSPERYRSVIDRGGYAKEEG